MATDSLCFHNFNYLDACLISSPKYGLLQVRNTTWIVEFVDDLLLPIIFLCQAV